MEQYNNGYQTIDIIGFGSESSRWYLVGNRACLRKVHTAGKVSKQ